MLAPATALASAADPRTEENSNEAYFSFASGGGSSQLTAEMMNKNAPNIVSKDDREGWQLDNSQGTTEAVTINCDISPDLRTMFQTVPCMR